MTMTKHMRPRELRASEANSQASRRGLDNSVGVRRTLAGRMDLCIGDELSQETTQLLFGSRDVGPAMHQCCQFGVVMLAGLAGD